MVVKNLRVDDLPITCVVLIKGTQCIGRTYWRVLSRKNHRLLSGFGASNKRLINKWRLLAKWLQVHISAGLQDRFTDLIQAGHLFLKDTADEPIEFHAVYKGNRICGRWLLKHEAKKRVRQGGCWELPRTIRFQREYL